MAKAGLRVMETICESKAGGGGEVERCPYFEPCSNNRYLSQFADKSPAIRIMPTANLSRPRGKTIPKPDLIIVDERFFQEAISQRDLGLDRLTAVSGDLHRGGYPLKTGMSLLNVNFAVNSLIRDALTEGRPLLAALCKAGHTAETLDDQARSMRAAVQNLNLSPALSDAEIRTRIASAERGEILTRASLLTILRDEIDKGRAEAHGVELRRNVPTKNGERQDRVYLHWRQPLSRLSDLPVLLLDADLDREIVSKLVPDLDVVEIAVERRAEIIQARNTRCSKRRLLGTNRVGDQRCAAARVDEIRKLAISEAALGQRVLVVTYKPVRLLLTGEDSKDKLPCGAPLKNSNLPVEVAHFGAIRGQDRWRDFDTVIVAGRHQMPLVEAEALARALYYDRDEPLIFLRPDENNNKLMAQEQRGYRMRDEQHAHAEVEAHPDHDVQALIEQHREAEMAQAVDRLRLVHNEKLKRVIILSNLPLDMTVDRLVRWQDIIPSRLKLVALTAQAVPLSVRELTRCFPEMWRTAKAVEGELRRAGLTPLAALIEYLLGVRGASSLVEYRRPGVRGGPVSQALVSGEADRLRSTLESVVGPVSWFRLVDDGFKPAGAEASREPPVEEIGVPAYAGGIMPARVVYWSRQRRRAACLSQEAMARRIGLSRPQLANAEQGRFGLSPEAAARLVALLAALPERQPELLL